MVDSAKKFEYNFSVLNETETLDTAIDAKIIHTNVRFDQFIVSSVYQVEYDRLSANGR